MNTYRLTDLVNQLEDLENEASALADELERAECTDQESAILSAIRQNNQERTAIEKELGI
jgi:hypothetical protein